MTPFGYTSLELSKRLKELGVAQESDCFSRWIERREIGAIGKKFKWEIEGFRSSEVRGEPIRAFSVAELGVALPSTIITEPDETYYWLASDKRSGKEEGSWMCSYGENGKCHIEEYAPNEADARAKMLIYLLENNLITVEEVNARLSSIGRKGE